MRSQENSREKLLQCMMCVAGVTLSLPERCIAQQLIQNNFVLTEPSGRSSAFGRPIFPEAVSGDLYVITGRAIASATEPTVINSDNINARAINLGQFATSAQYQQTQTRLDQLAFFARRDFQRLNEGIALASALTIMPPNPGDRFAVTVGGAGFNGRGAGAITGTYRVNESMMVFGGYARSETQNLVKGGAAFSFR